MSNKTIKVKEVVKYNGHSLGANGSVNLNLVASYGELVNTIQVMQMLNNNVTIKAKLRGGKPFVIGNFMVKQIVIDGDGESKLKFNGLIDYVEMDSLNGLPLKGEEVTEFVVLMEAEIEDETEFEDGEEG